MDPQIDQRARPAERLKRVSSRLLPVLLVMTLGPGVGTAIADSPVVGDTTVFASAPAPGHLFGVAVDENRIYVSTSAGDFFADPANGGHLNSDGERVFAYDEDGNLVSTTSIATMPNSNMGLFGLALDGNHGTNHQLYVADMNGRILRLAVGQKNATAVLAASTSICRGLDGDDVE